MPIEPAGDSPASLSDAESRHPMTAEPSNNRALRQRSAFAYAVGDLGINLYFMSAMTFLLIFYTDVFGLSAQVAAWVFLVARVIDAVTDPLMGYLADRTRSRWGKLRPYLLFGPVPLAVIAWATFTVPDFSDVGKVAWAYVTYVLFGIVYTVVTIPYAAMTGLLTEHHHERTKLSTLRMACAFAGGWGVSVGMMPLVGILGGGTVGWQWTMALFGVVATALLWCTFAGTRERIVAAPLAPISLREAGRALVTNPPLAVVILVFVLGMLAFTFRQASAPFYFKYNVGREELISLYFSVTLGVMFLGLVAIPALSARLGKAGAIRVGAAIAMVGGVGFYLTPADNVVMVFVWGALLSLGGAPVAVLGWAMIPDTVEYAQWRTGARADGVIFSTASFFQKLGKALGGWAVAALLAWFGYIANQPQSPETLHGILVLMSICPLLVNVVLLGVTFLYRLDGKTHERIVAELRKRASR